MPRLNKREYSTNRPIPGDSNLRRRPNVDQTESLPCQNSGGYHVCETPLVSGDSFQESQVHDLNVHQGLEETTVDVGTNKINTELH